MTRTLILGNGFDLFLGLKCSFGDYLRSSYFRQLEEDNHLKAFCTNQLQEDENWSDLENGVKSWTSSIEFPLVNYIDRLNDSRSVDIEKLKKDFGAFKLSIHRFVERAYSDLHNLHPHGTELVRKWVQKGDVRVYNFNYTSTLEDIAFDHGLKFKPNEFEHFYVHGSLKNGDIIFGSEDYSVAKGLGFTLKAVNPGFNPPNFQRIVKESKVIHIFGHSFGESDSSYFSGLFQEYLNQSYEYQKLVIFTKNENSESDLRERILNLLESKKLTSLYNRNHPPVFVRMDDLKNGFQGVLNDPEFFN